GVGASGHREEDFRFCGDRNQTQESSVIYQHNPANISIENTAQALIIKSPFLPNWRNSSYKYSLPPALGRYRFCVYWFESNRTLRLAYGKQSIPLGGDPASTIPRGQERQKTERTRAYIFNVSYIIKGGKNTSLEAKAEYSFSASPESMPVWKQDVQEQLTALDNLIAQPLTPTTGSMEQQRLRRVCCVFWGCITIMASLCALVVALPSPAQEMPHGRCVTSSTLSRAGVHSVLAGPWLIHGSVTCLLKAEHFFWKRGSGKRYLLQQLLTDKSLPGAHSHHRGSLLYPSRSLSPETILSPAPWPVVLSLQRNVTPLCVFWQEDTSASSGSWDSYGCTTVTGSSQTECRCNHLTYFAVLMVSSPEITSVHRNYLSIITYVGCLISALASICTIFFLYFRYSLMVHPTLPFCVLSLAMNTRVGTSSPSSCCLTWMGIEGYNLYRLVIEVFNAYHDHFLLKLCLAGWGLPFFCVMMIFLASWTNYGPFSIPIYESVDGRSTNATICWITDPLIHNTVNLAFFSVVFLFNSVMLGAMVREILRQNKKGHKLKHVLALFGLSILLGIPWALIFFSFTSGVFCLVSLYIFTIINSLQGFLIFLWYWTMVLQARKSPDSQSSSDSAKLQPSSS
ncbi:AGRG1 protein, partial [Pomatorhinus ruficollis]|nr:AGRG1 protein [Pomatorhinus ruficollis]